MAVDSGSESSDFSDDEYVDIDQHEAQEEDSDGELQRKFARGELKPGLIVQKEKFVREYKNNVPVLKQKLSEMYIKMPWIERFDITRGMAPMAPELDAEITEHGQRRERTMKFKDKRFSLEEDRLHNDFKREMTFYRQAQATVMEGYSRLTALDLPTVRPEDYFAQMAKSDEHMTKIRKRLLNKKMGQQMSERVKKIREIKKYGKRVQVEAEKQKQKDKKEMLDKIKKFRKGKTDSIDFLEDKGPLRKGGLKGKGMKGVKGKREFKNQKYGFGGVKKNSKRNDNNNFDGPMPAMKKPGAQKGKGGMKKGNRNKKTKSKHR